jgi:hypothetical protein
MNSMNIGLGEWLFVHDLGKVETGPAPRRVIAKKQPTALTKAAEGKRVAENRMNRMLDVLHSKFEA